MYFINKCSIIRTKPVIGRVLLTHTHCNMNKDNTKAFNRFWELLDSSTAIIVDGFLQETELIGTDEADYILCTESQEYAVHHTKPFMVEEGRGGEFILTHPDSDEPLKVTLLFWNHPKFYPFLV